MKTKIIFLSLIGLILTIGLFAQTETNVEVLNQLSEQFTKEWEQQQERVKEYAAKNNVQVLFTTEKGQLFQMVDVENGVPVYYATDNFGAAHTTRANELWDGGSTGLNLAGTDYDNLGEWDGGKVRVSHQEFTNNGASRVTQMDNTSGLHFHATHVAGTMVAAGVVSDAKGMAYDGELKSWDWNDDFAEMTAAGASGLEISNHSYGIPAGWVWNGSYQWMGAESISPDEDYRFGFYEIKSRYADLISYNSPNYLIVTSAGNSRGDGPSNAGQEGVPEINGGDDGYDCIPAHYAIAKNTLAVGAVKEVMDYTGPSDVYMTSFSSWGPADDGRIKPDVVGKGFDVYSTLETSNTAYGSLQGTSMSAPNVSGTLTLLRVHHQDITGGEIMRSATLKGLVIHTADECGPDPGPDYMFGWGLVNAERAANLITDDQGQNVMDELLLDDGDTYTRELNVPAGVPELRVTLCWTDPPAIPVSAQLNPTNAMLINDLDITITDASDNTYYPFQLDVSSPSSAATNDSKNLVDNVELVSIMDPAGGTYTIQISHEGTLSGDEQAFSLIVTGIDEYTEVPECTAGLLNPEDGAENVLPGELITWFPAPFASSYNVYFGTDGGGTSTPTNVYDGESVSTNGFSYPMDVNTTYYLQVVPVNGVGMADGCDEIWSFTTMAAISEYPYVEDVESVDVEEIPESWLTIDDSEIQWLSTDLTSNEGDMAMGCYNMDGLIETEMDNWFISPPFMFEGGKEYPVSFYYRNFIPNHEESLTVYWGSSPDPADMTNMMYEAIDFTGSGWNLGEVNLGAANAGIYFIGWHAESPTGYGIFLDDIMVDAGVSVNVAKNPWDQARIYAAGGNIHVEADESWSGASIEVVNLMGQVVYQGVYSQPAAFKIAGEENAGLYFATLRKGGHVFTRKLILTAN